MVEFSDGTVLECRGEYRIEEIDGVFYVVGDGLFVEVADPEEGRRAIDAVVSGIVYRRVKSRVGCERCRRTARCQGHTLGSEHPLFDPDPAAHS
jgi:hypothetical protein